VVSDVSKDGGPASTSVKQSNKNQFLMFSTYVFKTVVTVLVILILDWTLSSLVCLYSYINYLYLYLYAMSDNFSKSFIVPAIEVRWRR